MYVGWDNRCRMHGRVVDVNIVDGNAWVPYDGTNRPIAEEFVAAGIPREDVVIGFQSPDEGPFTDFAVS